MIKIVFILFFIYFLLVDIHKREIGIIPLILYTITSLIVGIYYKQFYILTFITSIIIFLINRKVKLYGSWDSIYFIINSFYLRWWESIAMIASGTILAFIIGYCLYKKGRRDLILPFFIFLIPFMIIYYFYGGIK